MTHACCASWDTNEATHRARARLRPAYVSVHGDEPDRRGVHARFRPGRGARARCAAAALGDARRAALVPSPAARLERVVRTGQPDFGGVVRRTAVAWRPRADVRLLPERAPAAPAAARRPARGPVRLLRRGPAEPVFGRRAGRGAQDLRKAAAGGARVCSAAGP